MPMISAIKIIKTSKKVLLIILIPNIGRLDKNSGSNAQCIAQAREAPIPKAS